MAPMVSLGSGKSGVVSPLPTRPISGVSTRAEMRLPATMIEDWRGAPEEPPAGGGGGAAGASVGGGGAPGDAPRGGGGGGVPRPTWVWGGKGGGGGGAGRIRENPAGGEFGGGPRREPDEDPAPAARLGRRGPQH